MSNPSPTIPVSAAGINLTVQDEPSLFLIRVYKIFLFLFFFFICLSVLYLKNSSILAWHVFKVNYSTLIFFPSIFLMVAPFCISLFAVSNSFIKRTFSFLFMTLISYGLFLYGYIHDFGDYIVLVYFFAPVVSFFFLVVLTVISLIMRNRVTEVVPHINKQALVKRVYVLGLSLTSIVFLLGFFVIKDTLVKKEKIDVNTGIRLLYQSGQCEKVPAGTYSRGFKSPDDCFYTFASMNNDNAYCLKIYDEAMKQTCSEMLVMRKTSKALKALYGAGKCEDIPMIENIDSYIKNKNAGRLDLITLETEINHCYEIKVSSILHFCEFKNNIPAGQTLQSCFVSKCEGVTPGPIQDKCLLMIKEKIK